VTRIVHMGVIGKEGVTVTKEAVSVTVAVQELRGTVQTVATHRRISDDRYL
jgi:hypothetical protein